MFREPRRRDVATPRSNLKRSIVANLLLHRCAKNEKGRCSSWPRPHSLSLSFSRLSERSNASRKDEREG